MAKAKKVCSWDQEPWKGHTIFTQGNVNEVLPGVTRPLYADLAAWWDYYWVAGVVDTLGARDMVHVEPPPCFTQLGFLGGRWSVNVSINLELSATWALGEGSSMLQSFFEGGDAIVSSATADASRAAAGRKIISEKWVNVEKYRKVSDRLSRASFTAARNRRHHALSDAELVALLDENTKLIGKLFETHYYATVGGGEYASLLGGLLDSYIKKHPPEWVTMLTSGLGGVESARPGQAIWDLSRLIAARPGLAAEFAAMTAEEALIRLAAPPNADWAALATAYRAFMAEFGWRGYRESDPSTPTWDESPGFVLSAIRADLEAPLSANPYAREAKAAKARERLEARIFGRIPRKDLTGFKKQLKLTQTLAREREAVKATWARACRNYRPVALELGRRLAVGKLIEAPADVWFLRWSEVQQAGEGKLTARVAKKAVTDRKEEYERLKEFIMPDGVFTWPSDLVALHGEMDESQRVFKALAVSPGVAEGRARVILDAYDDTEIEPGEILVAPVTDAPWTPLFIPAAAVVVEMGGVLSHAATVAREFGIPAVSGVKDATRIIKTGQLIRVDGNTGTVTILSR